MKAALNNVGSFFKQDARNVNDQIQNLSKNIRSEQIKYRKFDNYHKKTAY